MYFKIRQHELEEIIYEGNFPSDFSSVDGVREHKLQIVHQSLGSMNARQIWIDGLMITFGTASLNRHAKFFVESHTPVLEMSFILSGDTKINLDIFKNDIEIKPKEHNILYVPSMAGSYTAHKSSENIASFGVVISKEYFGRFTDLDSPMIMYMRERIEENRMVLLGKNNLSITPQMQLIIHEIMQCGKTGIAKHLFLESKVLELLMLQIEQYEQFQIMPATGVLKPGDVEKIYGAKLYVEENRDSHFTLSDLSREVGLNDFKLKKGFKEVYGTTVFGYLHELKMGKAKSLLLNTNKPILEISEEVGYKNPQHFSVAFKKQFGLKPSTLRGK